MSKEREYEHLSPTDARVGKQISFGGVAIEFIEVNPVDLAFGKKSYTVCYRVRDNRQSPPFVSDKAHLFVSESTNLIEEFRKIKDHYEEIKHQLRSK